MENLAFVILGSVGALFLLVLLFFIMSQKRQDKKDLEKSREILESLKIDIKAASEDFALDMSETEVRVQEMQETEAIDLEPAEAELTAEPMDEEISVMEPLVKQQVPLETTESEPASEISRPETTASTSEESSTDDAFKIESGSAVRDYEEELHLNSVSDFEFDSSKEEFDESDIEFFEVNINAETPKLDLTIENDIAERHPGESLFEMTDNQNELVLDLDDVVVDDKPRLEKDIQTPPQPAKTTDQTLKTEPIEIQAPDEINDDMSELEALFEVSSVVEEKVFSAKKSPLLDLDITSETITPQTTVDSTSPPPATPTTSTPTEPVPVDIPVDIPAPSPPAPEPKITEPKPDSAFDLENRKLHDKARRIARVIVNDIRNYNPDNLAEGIRIGNIMKTLGKEVERGRLLYIKRVSPDIVRETNYYREALINILADGQPELLGF